MAEYVNRQDLIKFLDNIQQPKMPITEGFKYITIDEAIKVVSERPIADVIERSEYETLRLVNLDLAETNKGLLSEHEQLLKLRSKIEKAIEEIQNANVCECHCITCIRTEDVLEIIKRNIGE